MFISPIAADKHWILGILAVCKQHVGVLAVQSVPKVNYYVLGIYTDILCENQCVLHWKLFLKILKNPKVEGLLLPNQLLSGVAEAHWTTLGKNSSAHFSTYPSSKNAMQWLTGTCAIDCTQCGGGMRLAGEEKVVANKWRLLHTLDFKKKKYGTEIMQKWCVERSGLFRSQPIFAVVKYCRGHQCEWKDQVSFRKSAKLQLARRLTFFEPFLHSPHLQYIPARRKSRVSRFQHSTVHNRRTFERLPLYGNVDTGTRSQCDRKRKLSDKNCNLPGLRKF